MRDFLKDFAFTFIAIGLMLSLLELYIDHRPCEFTAKYNEWYENKENITTLLIGNSHIQCNVNAKALGDNACNMAIGGSDLNLNKALAETYIPQMPQLKNVIINFDYQPISDDVEPSKTINKSAVAADRSWGNYLEYVHHRYLHIKAESICSKYAILCGQLHYKTLRNKEITDCSILGQEKTFQDDERFTFTEVTKTNYYAGLRSFIEIAKLASSYGIRIIAITSPEPPQSYLRQTTPENVEFMNQIMDSLSTIYPIEYKNYLFDISFMHKELYADIQHLNHRGATLLAQRVKEDFNL